MGSKKPRALNLAVLGLISGCATSVDTNPNEGPASPSAAATSGTEPPSGSPASLGGGGGLGTSSGVPTPAMGKTLLYAHTDTTLYEFDSENLGAAPKTIGNFDCVMSTHGSAMTDIAVSKEGKIFGVSETAVYPLSVQGPSVHCDATWTLPTTAKFYGLTMAPEHTVAEAEVLIGANSAGELFQIDASTGHTTQAGTLGKDAQGNPYELSGDIVFLANGGNPVGFATVRTCTPGRHGASPVCSAVDTLIEVDVRAVHAGTQSVLKSVRGPVKKGAWCKNAASPADFGSMFGIVALNDKVYGFSRKGDVVEIHNDDGSACLIAAYSMDKFAGAGVTTSAPVVAPPVK